MPPLPLTVMLYADRVVFLTLSYLGQFLYYCFIAAIVLGDRRALLVLCGLALANRLRKQRRAAPSPMTAQPSRC